MISGYLDEEDWGEGVCDGIGIGRRYESGDRAGLIGTRKGLS